MLVSAALTRRTLRSSGSSSSLTQGVYQWPRRLWRESGSSVTSNGHRSLTA